MFRLLVASSLCLFAVSAAPIDPETLQMFQLVKALDYSTLQAATAIFNNQETSKNQKTAALNDLISKISDPASKVAAEKLVAFFTLIENKLKSKLNEDVASLSPAAQEVVKKIAAEAFEDVDAPTKEVASKIKGLFESASPEVKKELGAAVEALRGQVGAF